MLLFWVFLDLRYFQFTGKLKITVFDIIWLVFISLVQSFVFLR